MSFKASLLDESIACVCCLLACFGGLCCSLCLLAPYACYVRCCALVYSSLLQCRLRCFVCFLCLARIVFPPVLVCLVGVCFVSVSVVCLLPVYVSSICCIDSVHGLLLVCFLSLFIVCRFDFLGFWFRCLCVVFCAFVLQLPLSACYFCYVWCVAQCCAVFF